MYHNYTNYTLGGYVITQCMGTTYSQHIQTIDKTNLNKYLSHRSNQIMIPMSKKNLLTLKLP